VNKILNFKKNKKVLSVGLIFSALILGGCTSITTAIKTTSQPVAIFIKPPIEVYCDHKGSRPEVVRNIYGGIKEVCTFSDGSQCDQWDYFMKNCQLGDNLLIVVKIYFANPDLDILEDSECGFVYPLDFKVSPYQNWEKKTLQGLLSGPTEDELAMGYFSLINPQTKLNSFVLENGLLKLDFSKEIKSDIKKPCQKKILRDQLEWTLTQFGSVGQLEITVDGEIDNFLEID
jgi:putative hemolysin